MEGHSHDDHDHHDHHDHGPDHSDHHDHEHSNHDHREPPDVSGWLASTKKLNCPACGATGALTLGGGIFCPTCGEVTTNPGYQAPAPAPEPESGQD